MSSKPTDAGVIQIGETFQIRRALSSKTCFDVCTRYLKGGRSHQTSTFVKRYISNWLKLGMTICRSMVEADQCSNRS